MEKSRGCKEDSKERSDDVTLKRARAKSRVFKNYPPCSSRDDTMGWMERIRLLSRGLSRKVRPRAGRRLITIPLLRRNCHYETRTTATPGNTITDTTTGASAAAAAVVIAITTAIPQPPSPTDNEKVARGSHHEQAEAGSYGAVALPTTRQKHTGGAGLGYLTGWLALGTKS